MNVIDMRKHVVCSYEELEAINVSNKLSQLDMNDAKAAEVSHDEDKTDTTAMKSKAVPSEDSDEKTDNKQLGI